MSCLALANLRVRFAGERGPVTVVRGVSFEVARGETLALVGESGSGKSVTALAIMGLLRKPRAEVSAEALTVDGADLRAARPRVARELRGRQIGLVFQDAQVALNPRMRIGRQIGAPIRQFEGSHGAALTRRVVELMEAVRIPSARSRLNSYPHELSGGLRQRVMIACALAMRPSFLIADEPTTALDVTLQWQILSLLDTLRREQDMGLVLITHDLDVVAERADRVAVMYAGRIVETGPTAQVLATPAHPYTAALLAAIPGARGKRLEPIPGSPPDLGTLGAGCSFAARCGHARAQCRVSTPTPRRVISGATSECLFPLLPEVTA